MPDFPVTISDLPPGVIHNWDRSLSSMADFLATTRGTLTSGVWATANAARLHPITLSKQVTVYQMATLNGTAVSGNIDIGIYDNNLNRLVSAGSTAQAGISSVQTFDVTDTVLPAGDYYLAISMDNTTGTVFRNINATTVTMFSYGVAYKLSSFPLPATLTSLGQSSGSFVPFVAAVTSGTVI